MVISHIECGVESVFFIIYNNNCYNSTVYSKVCILE